MATPEKLRILHENPPYRFDYVGRLPSGMQFLGFVTGVYYPTHVNSGEDWRLKKKWIAVLHCFDSDGNHVRSETRLGGYEIEGREIAGYKATSHLDRMFVELCDGRQPEYGDIWVRLFSVEIDGDTHGLNYERSEENPDEEWGEWVMLEPRDIMFHTPWDSGEYST